MKSTDSNFVARIVNNLDNKCGQIPIGPTCQTSGRIIQNLLEQVDSILTLSHLLPDPSSKLLEIQIRKVLQSLFIT
jgi:hypothetical protein